MKHRLTLLLLLITTAILVPACTPRIRLPEDPGVDSTARYLVVRAPYCSLKAEPDASTEDLGLLRRGEVRRIVESRYGNSKNEARVLWYKVEEKGVSGWIPMTEVETYRTLRQAQSAAGRMQ